MQASARSSIPPPTRPLSNPTLTASSEPLPDDDDDDDDDKDDDDDNDDDKDDDEDLPAPAPVDCLDSIAVLEEVCQS